MASVKKIPQRTCVACRTKRDKKDLMRIVLTPDGEIRYDPTGRAAGRGSYLCRNEECLRQAAKLAKGLRHPLTKEEISAILELANRSDD